jgi:ABC-type uncharacterized transport system substrate-binding protein
LRFSSLPSARSGWSCSSQIAPSVTRAAVIYDPATPSATGFLPLIAAAGRSFGVDVFVHGVHDTGEIEGVISALATEPSGGLIAIASPVVTQKRDLIVSRKQKSSTYDFWASLLC